jgi:DNA-binding winged helix-turn-helix (wHTH) protein
MRFQFGTFTVEDDTRQLLREDTAVHLSPKAFDLLITLIRERPRALPKADLHARVWPDTFVSDASLAMLVAEVRSALGESAREPRFLRTVHRHGYAFQGEAIEVEPGAIDTHRATGYWLVTSSRQIALLPGDNVVGRDPEVRIWLDEPSVSRRHALIRVGVDQITIEDLQSKNGTHVRETRVIAPTALKDGDELRFGSVVVRIRAWTSERTRTEADT